MKKFEDEIKGKVETVVTQPGCSMTREAWYNAEDIHELSDGWVSPEDHQAEIGKSKQQYEEYQEIYSKTAKKLNETELELSQLKSQLENQQPEIPEFVAKEIERLKSEGIKTLCDFYNCDVDWMTFGMENLRGDEFAVAKWFYHNTETFELAYSYGYTVAKEKRFYLKNKLTGLNLVEEKTFSLTGKHIGERFREFEMQYIPTDEQEARLYKNIFTQQEIDSMNTDSYEKIEVEE